MIKYKINILYYNNIWVLVYYIGLNITMIIIDIDEKEQIIIGLILTTDYRVQINVLKTTNIVYLKMSFRMIKK